MGNETDKKPTLTREEKLALLAKRLEKKPRPALPLTFAQQWMWSQEQRSPGLPAFHLSLVLELAGRLDVAGLERSVQEVARRHEPLRTHFGEVSGTPVQFVEAQARLPFTVEGLDEIPVDAREAAVRQRIQREVETPFDVSRGPLARVVLLRVSQERHVLLVVVHRIVADDASLEVFTDEVVALYGAFVQARPSPLPELPLQYSEHAAAQRAGLRGDVLDAHLELWRKRLSGAPHELELPTDRPRRFVTGRANGARPCCPCR